MTVILPIPDDLAARLGEAGDVSRRALEAFAAEEYRAGRLTRPELGRLLGFGTLGELDGFLQARGIDAGTARARPKPELRDRAADAGDLVSRFRAFRADKTLGGIDVLELIREGRRG